MTPAPLGPAAAGAGDIVLLAGIEPGPAALVAEQAAATGASVVHADLAGGLSGLAGAVADASATIVHLPALVGRFLPAPVPGGPQPSAATVVLHGPVVDATSGRCLRDLLGGSIEVLAWDPTAGAAPDRPAWAIEQAVADQPEAASALLVVRADGSSTRWVQPAAGVAGGVAVAAARGVVPDDVEVALAAEPVRDAGGMPVAGLDRAGIQRPAPLGPFAPPQTPNEQLVAACAERVTTTAPIGRTDRFADLALDRAAELWLVEGLADATGVRFRLAELRTLAAVADVAAALDRIEAGDEPVRRPLVHRLSGPADGSALLVLHDGTGTVDGAAGLADALGDSVAVAAFESPMLTGTDPAPFATVELLAARYARDVRLVQPAGPYRLAGWGFGAIAAFELARRLVEEGETVELVAVGAAGPRSADRTGPEPSARQRRPDRPARGTPLPVDQRAAAVAAEHRRLAASWTPRPAALPVAVAWPDDLGSADATLGWAAVAAGGITIDRLPAAPAELTPDAVIAWAPVLAARLP